MTLDSRAIALEGVGYSSVLLSLVGFADYASTPVTVRFRAKAIAASYLSAVATVEPAGARMVPSSASVFTVAGSADTPLVVRELAAVALPSLTATATHAGTYAVRVTADGVIVAEASAEPVLWRHVVVTGDMVMSARHSTPIRSVANDGTPISTTASEE